MKPIRSYFSWGARDLPHFSDFPVSGSNPWFERPTDWIDDDLTGTVEEVVLFPSCWPHSAEYTVPVYTRKLEILFWAASLEFHGRMVFDF